MTFNSEHDIGACLASFASQSIVRPVQVTVVDNASRDATVSVAKAAAEENELDYRILTLPNNIGYAGAINSALRQIPLACDVVVSNADIVLTSDCLAQLVSATEPDVAMVVPRLTTRAGRTLPTLRRTPTATTMWREALLGGRRARGEVVAVGPDYMRPHDCEWASGALVLITSACRAVMPYWDETYFLYSEETEAMLRARSLGMRISYQPSARAIHGEGDLERDPSLWRLQVRNRLALFRRRNGLVRSLAFHGGLIVNEAVRAPRHHLHRAGLGAALRPGSVTHTGPAGVVCFAAVDWWYHNRAHSDLALARGIAMRRPTVIVNSIGLRIPTPQRSVGSTRRIARKVASLLHFVRKVDEARPLLAVMTAVAVPGVQALRTASGHLIAWQVRAVTGWFLMGSPHVLVTIPTAVDVLPHLPHRSVTYNRSDLHSSFPEVDGRLIEEMERSLLETADAVVYVSHALMARDAVDQDPAGHPDDNRRAHFLDHGVDLALFSRTDGSEPPDLTDVPRPRVGFFGGLDDYVVDMRLIERLAVEIPDASVVLIGDATCPMETLTSLPNVFWIGRRDHEVIPSYGRAFDVAIMPWLDNEWIRNCNPIKLKEYLALDLPVVSTPYPELEPYSDIVHVAPSQEEFIDRVRALLRSPPSRTGAGPARVLGDDWGVKADALLGIMESVACAE